MSSSPAANLENSDAKAANAAGSEVNIPKSSTRAEELAKHWNVKARERNEILKSVKSLQSEIKDIQDMLEIIEDNGLYNTAVEALRECMARLRLEGVRKAH